jgi:transposase
LLKASFIPSSEQQAVRDLTRSRVTLLQERSRLVNRVQKVLEDANIKLASVVTDSMGVTGHAIVSALVAGEVVTSRLAKLAQGSLVKKQDQLKAALQGNLTPHHHILLEELLQLIATLNRSIAHLDREIAERLRAQDARISRLDAVTGLSWRSSEVLLGELGWDMSHFPDAAHAASWVGIVRCITRLNIPGTARKNSKGGSWVNGLPRVERQRGQEHATKSGRAPKDAYGTVPQDPRNRVRATLLEV